MTDAARPIIVGCGHMGLAIVRGLLGASLDTDVVIVEKDAERRMWLSEQAGLATTEHLEIADGDLVVLAVPPQAFAEFTEMEARKFTPTTPVLSVMAGLTCATLGKALGTAQVVRAIPNTPSEVFEGMSVFFAGPTVSDETISRSDALLGAIGRTLRVDTEELVDDATALCGGGPAFVSYIVDAFCAFATSRGFSEAASRAMTVQVFGGTAALIDQSGKAPMQLCREVMTPNGTTERGIAAFDAAELKESVMAALTASASRSRELAQCGGTDG